jgi:glycosyltransferase involved in cell wall biosynthesis
MSRLGVDVTLVDDPGFSRLTLAEVDGDPSLPSRRTTPPLAAATALQITLPTLAAPVSAGRRVLFSMFEATRIPPHWQAASRLHDAIVVPTASSFKAWAAAGFPAGRLRLCPLGVDVERFHPAVQPLDLSDRRGRRLLDHRTRFLAVAEVMPRKNLPGLIRTWLRATRADDDAVLVIKLGGLSPVSAVTLMQAVELVEREVGRRREQAAPMVWLSNLLAEDEVPRLFALATHYVSLSFGEGWDLPMLQAGAMGKKLLAPAHSGYLGYLDDRAARLLPVREVPAHDETDAALASIVRGAREVQNLFAGACWWRPDEEAAASCIRRAVAGQDRDWPIDSARLRGHTWEASARQLVGVLDELGACPRLRPGVRPGH